MWNVIFSHSPLLYFTQSLWRDEAFSILAAQKPIDFILQNLTFEPPVYYLLLHYWIKIFGAGEIAARSLSLLGFTLATAVVIIWSEKLFRRSPLGTRNHWLCWVTPLLFFTNPMLLYYAFEIRTYAWYTFFATLSLFAYQQARWRLFVLSTILGFYTHTYFLFLFLSVCLHWMVVHRRNLFMPRTLLRDPMVASALLIVTAMLPWMIRITKDAGMLKQSWYFPVHWNLILSVLGNMYLGYEGTPWYLWGFTAQWSLLLVGLFAWAMRNKRARARNALFLFSVLIPLATVIGVSFVKPLFVNRYLISVTVAEVFLVALAIEATKNPYAQKLIAFSLLLFSFAFNIWYPSQHPKVNIRATVREINAMKTDHDILLAGSPLVLFETIYYASNPSRVYLYNPHAVPFPWYVGSVLVDEDRMVNDLPVYPVRAFLIAEDGSYRIAYRAPASGFARKL